MNMRIRVYNFIFYSCLLIKRNKMFRKLPRSCRNFNITFGTGDNYFYNLYNFYMTKNFFF